MRQLFWGQIAPSERHTRSYAAGIFAVVARRKWDPKFPIFYALGPQLNTFMSVGILLQFFSS